jgi:hypothetical protein
MQKEFTGNILLPRLVSHDKQTGIKNVVGYISLDNSVNSPAHLFNVIYNQPHVGDSISLINIIIYNKVYSKDVATIDNSIDAPKLYQMVNSEKLIPFYSKGWSEDEKAYTESGEKVSFAKPYAEAVEQWLNKIFAK